MFLERSINDPPPHFKHLSLLPPSPSATPPPLKILIVHLAVKVCLELVTMCCNMSNVRVGTTDSALQYLLNNTTKNDFKSNLNFKRNSTFITTSDDDDSSTAADGGESTETAGKCCKVTTTDVNEGAGKVDKTIDVDVVVPDEYELHDFSITDEGIISFGEGN